VIAGGDRGGNQRDGAGVEVAGDGAQVDGDGGVAGAGGDGAPQLTLAAA
jgi:hypothetical protein